MDFETFCEYYNNISVSIENDIYFEEILNRVWNLSNSELEKLLNTELKPEFCPASKEPMDPKLPV